MVDVPLNQQKIITTSATTAPSAGTSETWTVTALAAGIPALAAGQTYALVDATDNATSPQQLEVVLVTAATGSGATSITVTRGADGTTPVAHANPSTFAIVLVANSLAYPVMPYYAPRGLKYAETFDPRLSCYNCRPETMHAWRAAEKKLVGGTADVHVYAVFDSTGTDYNGATYVAEYAIPRQTGKAIAKQLGDVPYVDGYKRAMAANGVLGAECASTGACTTGVASSYGLLTSTGAGTVTQTLIDQGTSVNILTSNLQTNAIAWTIDGVTQTPIVASGASTMKLTTVAGLANKPHVVQIQPAAGQSMIYGGAWASNPAIKQFYMHNLSLGGARANSGSNQQNFSDVTSNGWGTVVQAEITAIGGPISLIFGCLGNNDAFQSVAAATILVGISKYRSYWPTAPLLLMHPPMVPATNVAIFDALSGGFYSQSETDGAMFFDWNAYENFSASFIADGLAGADNIHPTDAEKIGIGRHAAHILADMTSPAERSYQLTEVSGSYPPRPAGALGGQVNYTGPDQPGDALDGDTWDDLP